MGKALAEAFPQARAVLAEVDEALGQNLSGLMFEGPPAELTLTANAQPALLAVSLAAVRVLEAEAGLNLARDASFVAGHSLGEYSALAAAGSLGVGAAAKLLRVRGLAMQEAVPVGTGAMAALLGLDYDAALAIAKQAADETGRRRDLRGRQRQWRWPGCGVRVPRRSASRDRNRQGARRAPFNSVAGVGAVSLRLDATRRRGNGGGARHGRHQAALRCARLECPGGAGHRAGRDPQASCRPGDRRGALA